MTSKPSGLTPEYAKQFQDTSIVQAYKYREPYSEETFHLLREIAEVTAPVIADLGCGTGDLSFGMSRFAEKIDAVDFSDKMIFDAQKNFGHLKNVNWITAPAESAPLKEKYDLITAADSVHWMDWPILSQKLRNWLKPGRFFAVVGRGYTNKDWWDADFQSIISTYSTNKNFQRYDIIVELEKSKLFRIVGDKWTAPISFTQKVEELIEAYHSRNGFSRERMGTSAAAFDRAASEHLARFATDGVLKLHSVSRVTWMSVI